MTLIINNKFNIPLQTPIAVAVSGGIDSMALALSLSQTGYNPICLIVDHKLRLSSTKQALATKKILDTLKIKATILTWHHSEITKNLEEQAREARYALLTQQCNKMNIKYLFLGHHADDQIETFLLNLSRGSGVDGLCGMPLIRELNGINFVRPFLEVYKKDLQLFLEQNNIKWIEDESNNNDKIKRNKLRQTIKQVLPDLYKKRILLAVNNLQQSKNVLDKHYNKILDEIIVWHENQATFNRKKYMMLLEAERTWILNAIFKKLTNSSNKLRLKKIKNLDTNIFKGIKKTTLVHCKVLIADKIIITSNHE